MRLYVWRPDGHGPLSFFVMAEDEATARAAVDARVKALLKRHGYYVSGWGTSDYELTVYEAGEVVEHANH